MYRKKGTNVIIEEVLAKIRNPAHITITEPVVYASSDRVKAKTVLDRLLAKTVRNEISSIEKVVTEVSEN